MWTETELAYLAGLLDGEGHIAIRIRRRKDKYTFDAILRVSNTSYELMQWVLTTFGGTWAVRQHKVTHWRIGYDINWMGSYVQDLALANALLPYVRLSNVNYSYL